MSEQKKQFQIHLPGLLKVLAESLYSSKKVGIRELIQNAHDSCVRRQVEAKERYYKPRINISVDTEHQSVIIQDNGSGLTEDEVTEYLSTIGRSYTRKLGEDLAILRPEEASRLVGQFGLGFLSAFLIAEEVILTTKSYKEGSEGLQWRSAGDVHYNVSPVDDAEVGTRVELRVKPEASFLVNERVLIDAVHNYADFLEIPVTVGNEPQPANAMMPPWEATDPETAIQAYVKRKFNGMTPLATIPLHDQEIEVGHGDSVTVPLEGFLFIPPATLASLHEYGDVNIYIRRMFITESHKQLLPSWAKFLRGVVDCPYLQPTASREDIQQDDMFFKVQKALDEQITKGMRDIAKNDPLTWKRIVRGHRYLIMAWAVRDDVFFKEVMDIITFKTPNGDKTLPEYLEETGGTIYYGEQKIGSQQDQLLGAGYGVPVLDASMTIEPEFLKKYASINNSRIVYMDNDAKDLLKPASDDAFESIIDYFAQRKIIATVVTFKPTDVPAIVSYPKDAEFIRDTRDALDKGELPSPFANLVGDYMNKMDVDEDALAGTIHLNASNPLMKQLSTMETDKARDSALEIVYQMARIFAGKMLRTDDITNAFKISADSIQNLLDD